MKIKNLKLKIIFLGSSKYVIPIIEVLQKNFDLSLVLTTENPKPTLASQGDALRSYPAIKYCIENKIPYVSISNLSDPKVNNQLSNVNCQLAVLADFGLIIPNHVLNLFPKGIINIHPSLLPKYRGPTPVQTAILNGEKKTGVTIIKLDEEIDHGPILAQIEEPISKNDTSESLYARLFRLGSSLIVRTIELYLKVKITPKEQNHTKSTFTKHLTRADGYIDILKLKTRNSKLKIDRMIRAYFPWPGVWTKLKVNSALQSEKLKIIKFLPGNLIQVEGKKPMSYKDFINGYPEAKNVLSML